MAKPIEEPQKNAESSFESKQVESSFITKLSQERQRSPRLRIQVGWIQLRGQAKPKKQRIPNPTLNPSSWLSQSRSPKKCWIQLHHQAKPKTPKMLNPASNPSQVKPSRAKPSQKGGKLQRCQSVTSIDPSWKVNGETKRRFDLWPPFSGEEEKEEEEEEEEDVDDDASCHDRLAPFD